MEAMPEALVDVSFFVFLRKIAMTISKREENAVDCEASDNRKTIRNDKMM